MVEKISDRNRLEGKAFDTQIVERIKNGHIPDLRCVKKCDYFYNNSWRDPEFVKIDMQEQFEIINALLVKYYNSEKNIKILEIGCGPGYFSLELARHGYFVTGLDLSEESIKTAKLFAEKDPWKKNRGSLDYCCKDVFELQEVKEFDVIIFIGSLHHFANQEQLLSKVKKLLKKNALIIAHEPTRDRVTKGNAAIKTLIQSLVSFHGNYYEDSYNKTVNRIDDAVTETYNELKYETEDGEKIQSINDNEAGFKEMMKCLESKFETYHFEERYAIFHEIIGGLRYNDKRDRELAIFIHDFDKYLCDLGVLQSTEFLFVGINRLDG